MDIATLLSKKQFRVLERAWRDLNNKKKFIQSPSMQTIKDENLSRKPYVNIAAGALFFSEESSGLMNRFVETLCDLPEIGKLFSVSSVYESAFDEWKNSIVCPAPHTFALALQEIGKTLEENLDLREYFFPLKGLTLTDIRSVMFDDVHLIKFDEQNLQDTLNYEKQAGEDAGFINILDEFLKHNRLYWG